MCDTNWREVRRSLSITEELGEGDETGEEQEREVWKQCKWG